jgi:predicted transcriptional regulator
MNNNKFSKKEIAKELGLTVHGIHRHINLYLLDY